MTSQLQPPNLSSPLLRALYSAILPYVAMAPVLSGAPPAELVTGVTKESRHEDAYFSVLGDYRNYYTGYEPLCFKSITPGSPGHYGLRLVFTSNQPGFRQVEFAGESGDFRVLPDGDLFIGLDGKGAAVQEKTYRVRAVFDSPQPETVYTIRVNCMTRAAFEQSGGYRNRDIIKLSCEPRLNFGARRPENWKTFKATPADIAFAQKQWGHLLPGVSSDYEKAKVLSKALLRDLQGCGGMPSAMIYGLKGFEKYEAIRAGKSKFACAQFSEIFSKACNSFGVVNRWGFLNDDLKNDDVLIEIGSSHLVTEIFDRQRNQWIFIDGHQQTMGAYLGDVGPLTAHEFMLFINQPYRRDRLNVVYYDVLKDEERTMPVDQCPKQYLSYRGWTKGFHTTYRDEPPAGLDPMGK